MFAASSDEEEDRAPTNLGPGVTSTQALGLDDSDDEEEQFEPGPSTSSRVSLTQAQSLDLEDSDDDAVAVSSREVGASMILEGRASSAPAPTKRGAEDAELPPEAQVGGDDEEDDDDDPIVSRKRRKTSSMPTGKGRHRHR